nr:cytochrome b [Meteorus sp. 2 XHS-2023a]
MSWIYKDKVYSILMKSFVFLPVPINLTVLWNLGSILAICLLIQIFTGLILSMHYVAHEDYAFDSIVHIMHNVNYGWLIRLIHMNGASVFFMSVYIHMGRGIYYNSQNLYKIWFIGLIIFITMMATAFMGYVLPWGQMSFWGATVITSMMSALPYIGQMLVEWLWGGFSVSNSTLGRFYTFHFILPFLLLSLVLLHLVYLHESGSNNPLGLKSKYYMIKFHVYFTFKDIVGFCLLFMLLMFMVLEYPYLLGDSENFIEANPMVTPIHIQPEWYFLYAYTILRSIPNKLGGVLTLFMSLVVILFVPFLDKGLFQSMLMYYLNQVYFWMFVSNFFMLTWLGSQPIEYPYVLMGQVGTLFYFLYFLTSQKLKKIWEKFM